MAYDFVTIGGAEDLAARIRTYWAERGYDVQTRVEPFTRTEGKTETLFVVRSDMVCGLPQRRAQAVAA